MFLFSGMKTGNPVLHFAIENSVLMKNADERYGKA